MLEDNISAQFSYTALKLIVNKYAALQEGFAYLPVQRQEKIIKSITVVEKIIYCNTSFTV